MTLTHCGSFRHGSRASDTEDTELRTLSLSKCRSVEVSKCAEVSIYSVRNKSYKLVNKIKIIFVSIKLETVWA